MQNGIASLLIVIILSVAALIIAVSVSNTGLFELDLGYISQKGEEAFYIADGCMEETLRRIRLDASYGVGAGVINLSLGNSSCTIEVIDPGGSQRKVEVMGTISNYNKKVEAVLTLSGGVITINSWEEKSN